MLTGDSFGPIKGGYMIFNCRLHKFVVLQERYPRYDGDGYADKYAMAVECLDHQDQKAHFQLHVFFDERER